MKRVLFSILCGILFPILYLAIVESICELIFPEYHLDQMEVYGETSMGLILAPIAIPIWIYDYIRFNHYLGLRFIFDTVWFRIFWLIGFNISLYTILGYFLFGYFRFSKRSKESSNQMPPLPPQF